MQQEAQDQYYPMVLRCAMGILGVGCFLLWCICFPMFGAYAATELYHQHIRLVDDATRLTATIAAIPFTVLYLVDSLPFGMNVLLLFQGARKGRTAFDYRWEGQQEVLDVTSNVFGMLLLAIQIGFIFGGKQVRGVLDLVYLYLLTMVGLKRSRMLSPLIPPPPKEENQNSSRSSTEKVSMLIKFLRFIIIE